MKTEKKGYERKEHNMSYKFSSSSLSLLKDFPRCLWLAFNKNSKKSVRIFPSLPSGMDGILKKHFSLVLETLRL